MPKKLDVGKIEIRKLIFTIDGAILQQTSGLFIKFC